jgi:hypothetical protein
MTPFFTEPVPEMGPFAVDELKTRHNRPDLTRKDIEAA